VFETAAGLGDHGEEVIVRIDQRAHHVLRGHDDLLHVGRRLVGVDHRGVAFKQHDVALAIDGELAGQGIADDDGAVDDGVEIGGAEGVGRSRDGF
jgi:hypothetical protein